MKNIESKQPSSDTRHIFGTQNDYAQMFQMIIGFNVSQVVHTAALYSLAEHLAQGPATPAEIAEAESLNVDATFRLMRACASIGLMTHDGHSKFAATPLLNTLHKDDANSLRGVAARIAHHGVGEFLDIEDLTIERVRELIEQVLNGPGYREKARWFQKVIAQTNGLDLAAEVIERAFK